MIPKWKNNPAIGKKTFVNNHISENLSKTLAFSVTIIYAYARSKGRLRVCRICCKIMKHSRAYKTYPTWRQRELRFLALSLAIGLVAAAIAGLVVYLASGRSSPF
jgi:hypothetical protein